MMLSKLMSKKAGGVPRADTSDQEDVNMGLAEEAKEHPWMSPKDLRRLVMDHLKQDEDYYEDEEEPETDEKGD